jgi:hypothetical protein
MPFYPGNYYNPTGLTPTTDVDLVAACIAWLRSYNSGSVASAFGDTGPTGNSKFQSDDPTNQDPPYLFFLEPESQESYENTGDSIEQGILAVHIFAGNLRQAKSLSKQVIDALNDVPLAFSSGTLLYLRNIPKFVRPSSEPGVGIPVERERIIGFRYLIEGASS